jgi:hypothetical protein
LWIVAVEATLPNFGKQERARTPDEERLRQERAEEIAAASREAELRLPGLKYLNSDGNWVKYEEWEGWRRPEISENDPGMSLLGAIRQIVAQGLDGERLLVLFARASRASRGDRGKRLGFHVHNTHAEAKMAYESAVSIFRQAAVQNLIEAEGFTEATNERSSITPAQWKDWEIDGWRNRLIDPADSTRTITNVWIKNKTSVLHLREAVANVTKPHKHDGTRSKANAKKQCKAWLIDLMSSSPKCRPKIKEEYLKEAQAAFCVTERQFILAYAEAVEETGSEWSRHGRPKKSGQKNPRTN